MPISPSIHTLSHLITTDAPQRRHLSRLNSAHLHLRQIRELHTERAQIDTERAHLAETKFLVQRLRCGSGLDVGWNSFSQSFLPSPIDDQTCCAAPPLRLACLERRKNYPLFSALVFGRQNTDSGTYPTVGPQLSSWADRRAIL